jgi:hypothetical protein
MCPHRTHMCGAWLPPDVRPSHQTVQATLDGWTVVRGAEHGRKSGADILTARIVAKQPDISGAPAVVQGNQGAFRAADGNNEVWTGLGTGYWLQVSGLFDQADRVHIADTIKVGDLSFPWLGQR